MTERERLQKLMDTENMSAKQFAQEIGVSMGTISNIVNGRNNPSLDVMQRVMRRFSATISPTWLFMGEGSMYRQPNEQPVQTLFDSLPIEPPIVAPQQVSNQGILTTQSSLVPNSAVSNNPTIPSNASVATSTYTTPPIVDEISATTPINRKIEKIVIFYSDDTYETFNR